MTGIRIGSMCSGYGGLDAGVRMVLGGQLAWVADSDPDASKVLAHRFPGIPNHGDIRAADWPAVEPVDLLAFGFPCQPVSHAGQRKGVHDERWIFDDIASAVGRMGSRPRLLVLENVEGLLSANGGDAVARVVHGLAALGYVGRYRVVRASDAGAPHARKRWFCVAWLAEDARRAARGERRIAAPRQAEGRRPRADAGGPGGARAAADADAGGRRTLERGLCTGQSDAGRGALANTAGGGQSARHRAGDGRAEAVGSEAVRRPGNGGDAPADAERGGREGRPHVAERGEEGRAAARRDSDAPADSGGDGLARGEERDSEAEQPQADHADRRVDPRGCVLDWGPYGPAIGRWERVLGRPAPRPTVPSGKDGAERLNPVFVEWLMGLGEGHVTGVPGLTRNAMLKILGNGCVPQQVALAVRLLAPAWALELGAAA